MLGYLYTCFKKEVIALSNGTFASLGLCSTWLLLLVLLGQVYSKANMGSLLTS